MAWRSLVSSSDPKFMVKGTELSVCLSFGRRSRFAVYEVRCFTGADRMPDRYFRIRDAEGISDADVKLGKRPPVVATCDTEDQVYKAIVKFQN